MRSRLRTRCSSTESALSLPNLNPPSTLPCTPPPFHTRKIFVEYFAHHKRDDLEVGSREVRTWRLGEIPMQTNKIDCGVFKCMFASAIVLGLDVNFGQVNINSLR